jgi:hypothetical protein
LFLEGRVIQSAFNNADEVVYSPILGDLELQQPNPRLSEFILTKHVFVSSVFQGVGILIKFSHAYYRVPYKLVHGLL